MKSKIFLTLFLAVLMVVPIFACEVCKAQQPKVFRGVIHGTGPEGAVDWIILGVSALIVLVTLILSIKFLVKPGEKNPDHIKYIVLDKN